MDKKYANIGILAHVDSGKTTLTEQMLYLMGEVRRAGSVDSGNTITDNLAIERERGISVRTQTVSAVWNGMNINIIDTPGHVDFAGEVERSLAVLDYAIVVVSAVDGVRAHTESIIRALDGMKIPRLVFVNKLDRAGADTAGVIKELRALNGKQYPLFSEVTNEADADAAVGMIDEDSFILAAEEALADTELEAEEAFLSDEPMDAERTDSLLRTHILSCDVTPVLCGAAKNGVGVAELCDFMVKYMPDSTSRECDGLCGVIYKIEHDPRMGKAAHIRLFGGKIENRDEVTLHNPPSDDGEKARDGEEDDAVEAYRPSDEKNGVSGKVSQIRKFVGGKYVDCGEVGAGDIAALYGLSGAKTGQFVGSLDVSREYRLTSPFLRVRVTPPVGEDEKLPALAAALAELSDEEPLLDAKWQNGQKEITVSTTGKIQLEVVGALLRERYGMGAVFSQPSVIYKETPSKKGRAYADYTMPKPCWAVVEFLFEPMPRGYGVSYHGRLPSNQLFYRYQSHIRTSFGECLKQGLYGWEVTDFRCTLVGGAHHTIHTHPLDFFVCTPMAFMNGMLSLGSTVLEPLLKMNIVCGTELLGKVLGEISLMGGEYDSPVLSSDSASVEAIVPVAASMDFPQKLASLSSGKAVLSASFYGYRECRDGKEHINPRIGVNPLNRSKWILWARGAYKLPE